MLAFIDESGDSGKKFNDGSSLYFSCVMAIFSDNAAAHACDSAIEDLRRELGFAASYEFHFSHCPDRVRELFLRRVAAESFELFGFVLNKPRLYGHRFGDREGFYHFIIGLICESARSVLRDATVVVDRCGDRDFVRRLEKSLKGQVNSTGITRVRRVKMEHSHSNNLVQLADMACGAIARSYVNSGEKSAQLRNVLRTKETNIQFWPK